MSETKRKNYSFYMPVDYSEKLEMIQKSNPILASLSKSQLTYYLICKLADDVCKSDEK